MKKVEIYTDGACSGNPGPGGWGALLIYNNTEKEIFGGEEHTTNNRMELTAAIQGLMSLNKPCEVIIYTDSKYVKDGITTWLASWERNNWKTSSNKPVKNIDLWEQLSSLVKLHKVSWQWVKGHHQSEGNIRADKLAVNGRIGYERK